MANPRIFVWEPVIEFIHQSKQNSYIYIYIYIKVSHIYNHNFLRLKIFLKKFLLLSMSTNIV